MVTKSANRQHVMQMSSNVRDLHLHRIHRAFYAPQLTALQGVLRFHSVLLLQQGSSLKLKGMAEVGKNEG